MPDHIRKTQDNSAAAKNPIAQAISVLTQGKSRDNLLAVLEAIRVEINEKGTLLIPVAAPQMAAATGADPQNEQTANKEQGGDEPGLGVRKIKLDDGQEAVAAFTDREEAAKGQATSVIPQDINDYLAAVMATPQIAGVIINPWGESFLLPKELIQAIFEANKPQKPNNHIYFDQGDITTLQCDCIVNAANESLLGGGGVDGAIHRAAGPELLAECRGLNGCATGEAKITKGYKLPAQYVIHTVGPVYSGTERDQELLINCYWNALDLARQHDIHSIAFPAISTGAYGYPLQEAVPIAVLTVSRWLEDNRDYGMAVIMSCYDPLTFAMFQAFVEEYKLGVSQDKHKDSGRTIEQKSGYPKI